MQIILVFLIQILFGLYLQSPLLGADESAATKQPSVTELDPVVVTASAEPTSLTTAPASVTVITREQIEQQQANRLSEVLERVPGLYIDEKGGRGGMSSVYLRGGDANFTLIMIDGIPINDPTNQQGGSVDLSLLTPERIERVEIIRGPLSALYGSEALSGVINIITQSGQDESHQLIRAAGGRFGYTREVLQARGPLPGIPLQYSLSGSYARNDAQVEGDRYQLGTVGWHFNLPQDFPVRLQWTGKYLQTNTRGFPEGSGGPRFAILRSTEKRDTEEFLTGLKLSHVIRSGWRQDLLLNMFRQVQTVDNPGVQSAPNVFGIPPTTFKTTYTRFRPRWSHTAQIHPHWTLTGGTQLIAEIGKRSGIQRLSITGLAPDQATDFKLTRLTPAVFVETSATMFSRLNATAGVRLDIPEDSSREFSPRVALRYQATPSLSLRGGYGEGFKLPSLAGLADPNFGNPDLVPETNTAWDVGFRHSLADNLVITELTYFHNRFSNLIDLDPNLARQGIFRAANLNKVTTEGVELSVNIVPIPWLSVYGFLTYLKTDIEGTSDPLRNRPEWNGGTILTATPSSSWTIRTQIRAVGKRFDMQMPTTQDEVAGFVKVDLAVTYRPTKSWHVFGVIENLTNTTYENFVGFPEPGISPRFGVEFVS